MPNWCLNKLTITGPEADVQAFKTKAVDIHLGRSRRESLTCSTSTAWFLCLMKS